MVVDESWEMVLPITPSGYNGTNIQAALEELYWVLLLNYMIFRAVKMFFLLERTAKYRLNYSLSCLGLIVIPVIISLFIYYNYNEKRGECQCNNCPA